jgi:hypothetical protein
MTNRAKKHRILGGEEVIREGDEFSIDGGKFYNEIHEINQWIIGCKTSYFEGIFRREVRKKKIG